MKTRSVLIVMLLVFAGIISTTNLKAQAKVGSVIGINFSEMHGDVKADGLLFGFHIGALANFGITNNLMIEPQVVYTTKGIKQKTEDVILGYVEVPVWIRLQSNNGLYVNAGPYASFLVSAKFADVNVKDNYNGTDFGVGAGIGYQSEGGIGFAANYLSGLTDVGKAQTILGTRNNFNAKNSSIKLSITITFGGRR